MKKLRIGILSAANIARTNWTAIARSKNCVVAAVASRDLARTRKFISECQRQTPLGYKPEAFGSYDELLASKNVDAVYLPMPTALRKDIAIRAANAGKHILSEKPAAVSAPALEAVLTAGKKNRVQYLDGVMFMHHPRLGKIRQALDNSKSLGRIVRINSHFSFCGSNEFHKTDIRVNRELEPMGCLGDLGWYCIRIALWTMNWQMPRRVEGRIITGAAKIPKLPLEFSGELFFDGGVSSGFYCSFLTVFRQWVEVTGTNGYLRIPDFCRPVEERNIGYEMNHRDFKAGCAWDAQQVYMFENFGKQILSGKLNDEWPMWALKTQQVTDACFASALGKLKRNLTTD